MKTIKTLLYIVLGIIIIIIGLIFSMANMTPVTLKFYYYESTPMPLWFLIAISVLAGSILTITLVLCDLFRGQRSLSKLKKECKDLEKKLSQLKNQNDTLEEEKEHLKKSITGEIQKEPE